MPGSLDGLTGQWVRTDDPPGKQTYEHWTRVHDALYVGLGFTMTEGDTSWREDIRLVRQGEEWRFEVTGQGDSLPTIFTLTQLDSTGFVCENPAHDFPQKISYRISDNRIDAAIYGGETRIPFSFVRAQP